MSYSLYYSLLLLLLIHYFPYISNSMDLIYLLNSLLTIILTLYSYPNIPRKIVQVVVSLLDNCIRNIFLPSVKDDIVKILNLSHDSVEYHKIEKCLDEHYNIFNFIDSEKKFLIC